MCKYTAEEERLLDEFEACCEDIARGCEEEGYPSHGSNYELRCASEWRDYYLPQLQAIDPSWS